jgi:hypothetical protein
MNPKYPYHATTLVAAAAPPPAGNVDDASYQALLGRVERRFLDAVKGGAEPVFTTDTPNIWQLYLGSFPANHRQYHNCNACRRFLEIYGGLVTINPLTGWRTPVFWHPEDTAFGTEDRAAFDRLHAYVRMSPVIGVFLSSEPVWGTPRTDRRLQDKGDWRHFGFMPPASMILNDLLLDAGQKMAEKEQDFETVMRALTEYKPEHLNWAVELLESEQLYRAEKVLGPAKWLRDLQAKARGATGGFENAVWHAVATAPVGFCHPRSGMIGTLLDDLATGMSFDAVKRRFAEKMHPAKYQRPNAAPSVGNIEQGEKVVVDLGLASALRRRYATLADVAEKIWTPPVTAEHWSDGVFGSLRQRAMSANFGYPQSGRMSYTGLPSTTMTWEKFRREVLSKASKIELKVPRSGPFAALVTAVDSAAPPILQWDRTERRNPVSWYLHLDGHGQLATHWSLTAGSWANVTSICPQPSMWFGGKFDNQGESVFLLVEGCKDICGSGGLALFPEILRSELHSVRKTIEAYSATKRIEDTVGGPPACGVKLQKNSRLGVQLRVHTVSGVVSEYVIDRYD